MPYNKWLNNTNMSDTYIHKAKGRFNQGIEQDNIPFCLQKHYDRHNFEVGYFRELKSRLREKQAAEDMKIDMCCG